MQLWIKNTMPLEDCQDGTFQGLSNLGGYVGHVQVAQAVGAVRRTHPDQVVTALTCFFEYLMGNISPGDLEL